MHPGTVVFEGVFHGRSVAVKRLLKQFYDLAANEKDILILSDENPNLIRLYAMEEDDQFVYLALERCQASLASLMATRGMLMCFVSCSLLMWWVWMMDYCT